VLRLAVVVVLCGAIGLERQARDQIAGLRTHVIVGLGAALFTLFSAYGFPEFSHSRIDPTRVAAQVVFGQDAIHVQQPRVGHPSRRAR
jgi:putative Mg2+ transporter-C (MgtC) family protein